MSEIKEIVKDIAKGKEPESKISDVLIDRIQDSLEAKRVEVASNLYNTTSDSDE